MCRQLGSLPECVCVYAIAIANADYGEAMTPQVEAAIEPVLGAIEREIVEWQLQRGSDAATDFGVKVMRSRGNPAHDKALNSEGSDYA